MNIQKQYLTVSSYNRPGSTRSRTTAVACHYIGNPGTSAQANRNWFESLSKTHDTKASCHYIIGLNGEILQLIPEEEISWCTNQANSYTISIEACHPDKTGKFTDATYKAYVELCVDICRRWSLDPINGGLIRHYDVTGKVCPKWFVEHPRAWEQFKQDVAAKLYPIKAKEGWEKDQYGWWYRRADGTYPANQWEIINHHWYLFGANGYLRTGWHRWDPVTKQVDPADGSGSYYYLEESGEYEGACWHEVPGGSGALERWYIN